jgi:hypothetical protein
MRSGPVSLEAPPEHLSASRTSCRTSNRHRSPSGSASAAARNR